MLIINTTYALSSDLEERFLQWLRLTHLPQIIHENNLSGVTILKIPPTNEEQLSYCIQLHCTTYEALKVLKAQEQKYKQLLLREYGQEVLSFSTELHLVEQYNLYPDGAS